MYLRFFTRRWLDTAAQFTALNEQEMLRETSVRFKYSSAVIHFHSAPAARSADTVNKSTIRIDRER